MIGASKILTVSYGTFSCTLEGFDDPFNTMRAIAEYFRDLAADDRYFGAEPPTPDAAMLHKIAEREVQRRVEAKIGENGVTLRAENAPQPRVTMPAVQPAHQPAQQPPGPAPVLASMAEAAPAMESAAARLSRLRAAQTQIMAPVAPPAMLGDISSRFADVEAYAEDQEAATAFKPAPTPPAPMAVAAPPAAVVAPVAVAPVVVAPVVVTPDVVAPVAEPVVTVTEATPPEPVMAAAPEPVADVVEPETAEAAEAAAEPVLDALRETLAGLIGQDDQLVEDMASAAEQAAVLSVSDDVLPEDDAEIEDLPRMSAFDKAIEDFDQSDLAYLSALDTAPIIDDAAFVETEAASEPEAEVAIAEPVVIDAMGDETHVKQPEIEASPEAPIVAEKIQRARARVIKIRRLDKKPETPATLSPEAEADLQNTLAALAVEIAPQTDAVAAQAATLAPAAEKHSETRIAAADDAAVDRLLAQTNTELEGPETKRRRSAIAHLKAAVLATVADRRRNPTATAEVAEVKMDPYRKDLNHAVRPSPVPVDRLAPLVLVSAQRIDRKRDAIADANRPMPKIVPSAPALLLTQNTGAGLPVRPRRVTTRGLSQAGSPQAASTQPAEPEDGDLTRDALGNIFADGSKPSFAEFAEGLGASTMVELLEAAGAYCTLVLEQPSFTRPLLFQQISSMPQLADAKPEDSLRSFGMLLRDGRIQKTVRGQFALTETSPILTEAKRIAG